MRSWWFWQLHLSMAKPCLLLCQATSNCHTLVSCVLTGFLDLQVLIRARPTVSTKDLVTHTNFTKEFGEEG